MVPAVGSRIRRNGHPMDTEHCSGHNIVVSTIRFYLGQNDRQGKMWQPIALDYNPGCARRSHRCHHPESTIEVINSTANGQMETAFSFGNI